MIDDWGLEHLLVALVVLSATQVGVLIALLKVIFSFHGRLSADHQYRPTDDQAESVVDSEDKGAVEDEDLGWVRDAMELLERGDSAESVARSIDRPIDLVRLVAQFRGQ